MPDWKQEIRLRLANLKMEPTREAAIVEELSQHLEDRYTELLARGASEVEASRAALAELRERELLTRELRRVERVVSQDPIVLGARRINMIADLWQDMRYAVRMMMTLFLDPDAQVLIYTFLLSLLAGIAFGLLPTLRATRADLVSTLKDEGAAFGGRMTRSRPWIYRGGKANWSSGRRSDRVYGTEPVAEPGPAWQASADGAERRFRPGHWCSAGRPERPARRNRSSFLVCAAIGPSRYESNVSADFSRHRGNEASVASRGPSFMA